MFGFGLFLLMLLPYSVQDDCLYLVRADNLKKNKAGHSIAPLASREENLLLSFLHTSIQEIYLPVRPYCQLCSH